MDELRCGLILIALGIAAQIAPGQVIDRSKLVDLTYSFNEKTIYWPNAKRPE
jgi:hypothetical protein